MINHDNFLYNREILLAALLGFRGIFLPRYTEANRGKYVVLTTTLYLPLIFVLDGGVVGGSRAGPVVTPHTLELTPRGRVLLQLAPPETARAYLPPEYRPGRVYSDTDSEKVRHIQHST